MAVRGDCEGGNDEGFIHRAFTNGRVVDWIWRRVMSLPPGSQHGGPKGYALPNASDSVLSTQVSQPNEAPLRFISCCHSLMIGTSAAFAQSIRLHLYIGDDIAKLRPSAARG